jgi:transposase
LAHLLRLGILPEGYIYPKEQRPVRDLLRRRAHLMKLRTSLIVSIQNMIRNHCARGLNVNGIKKFSEDLVVPLFEGQQQLKVNAQVSKECIDFLTCKIRQVEAAVLQKARLQEAFGHLQTIPGVGKILSLTILLETGAVGRFPKAGDYASYCRKVRTTWTTNGKRKGKGNRKNGNKYLAWAYSEAAELARRYDAAARRFYNRKSACTNFMVAHNALAHKLARAAYYIMRDRVPFDREKLFVH